MSTTGTFDVQDVVIREKSSGHEIMCHFAPGSKVKGCRIVIISERRDCELHTTAIIAVLYHLSINNGCYTHN